MEVNHTRAFLDTNMALRYLTGQPREQANRAYRIINDSQELLISDVVLVETAHALRTQYQFSRESIIDGLIGFVQRDNVLVYAIDKAFVLQGLIMCRPSGRVSVADAMIWAAARTAGASAIYTFDERFPSDSVELRS